MNVVLEFSGGAELLFGNTRQHKVELPRVDSKWTIGQLLAWIKDNLLQERPELFLKDPSASQLDVRPGILVLVNESDWELLGQTEYEVEVRFSLQFQFTCTSTLASILFQEGDTIAFISTLHGG